MPSANFDRLPLTPFRMCMVLYLASQEKLPIIPFNSERPAFNTKELSEREKPVLRHFSLPHVIYVGSSEGCGCAFRHALYEKGEWIYLMEEETEEAMATQMNHQALVAYLNAARLNKFELYACWDGAFALPAEHEGEITAAEIVRPDFFFRERAYYQITSGS